MEGEIMAMSVFLASLGASSSSGGRILVMMSDWAMVWSAFGRTIHPTSV